MLLTLQERIARLERRTDLMMGMLDKSKDPWGWFCLEHEIETEQASGLCAAVESAHQAIERKEPLSDLDFEKSLLPFIPAKEKPNDIAYDFVKFLLMTLKKSRQWPDVVEHYGRSYNC